MEILFFVDEDGRKPVADWIRDLPGPARSKIATAIARMRAGNLAQLKSVGDGLLEYRIDWGPGYRLYLGRVGHELIVLVAGGSKSRQQDDIRTAKRRWSIYSANRRG